MRRLSVLIAAGLAAGALVSGPASPAVAEGVCAGAGVNLHLSKPLFYPIVGPTQTNVTGSASSNVGPTCTVDVTLTSAQCGNSTGFGTLNDGRGTYRFNIQTAGSAVVLTGQATGVLNAVPNSLLGDSCTSGADDFLVSGYICVTVISSTGVGSTVCIYF